MDPEVESGTDKLFLLFLKGAVLGGVLATVLSEAVRLRAPQAENTGTTSWVDPTNLRLHVFRKTFATLLHRPRGGRLYASAAVGTLRFAATKLYLEGENPRSQKSCDKAN